MTNEPYYWRSADPKNDPYGTRLAGKPVHAVYLNGYSACGLYKGKLGERYSGWVLDAFNVTKCKKCLKKLGFLELQVFYVYDTFWNLYTVIAKDEGSAEEKWKEQNNERYFKEVVPVRDAHAKVLLNRYFDGLEDTGE